MFLCISGIVSLKLRLQLAIWKLRKGVVRANLDHQERVEMGTVLISAEYLGVGELLCIYCAMSVKSLNF